MDLIATLPAFLLAVLLISASPGPAMALTIRRAALRGFRATVPVVLGLATGIYLWAIAAGAGLAALVAASETAYLVLRVTGAAFLICLGVRAWLTVWRERGHHPDESTPADVSQRVRSIWPAFGEGLLVQIANPKAAVFMFAFYPQFLDPDQPVLRSTAVLAAVQVGVEIVLYLALAGAVSRAGDVLRRPRVSRRLEALTGAVLIGLGLRVAVDSR